MDVKTQKKLDHLEETKHLIREAIEEKGQTVMDSDSFRSYADKIASIETGADVSVVTATAPHVLAGDVFVDAQGNPVEGTMPNRGNVRKQLDTAQASFVLSAGYYTGGNVYLLNDIKDATPTKEEQIIRPDSGKVLSQVTVAPIPDQYQDVTPVTATAEDVRAGKVIVDAQGNEVVGTLVVEQKAPDVIWVGKDSVANALVGTGVVRYVTFMNDDGTVTYGQKSVLVGTDCIEPVAGGYMDAPTKESTAEHTFTFSGGWATEPNGGKDSNALKNVTEDRTVYANFIAAVRYYTVTFYDDNGTTVLNTQSIAYGAKPSYTPSKTGYKFTGWVPEITEVTEDQSYTATWAKQESLTDYTWAQIAAMSVEEVRAKFALGSKKGNALLVGFEHDDLADGSGKAKMSFIHNGMNGSFQANALPDYYNNDWYAIQRVINNPSTWFSDYSELSAYIKPVKKKYVSSGSMSAGNAVISTIQQSLWFPSASEMGYIVNSSTVPDEGEAYEFFNPVSYGNKISYPGFSAYASFALGDRYLRTSTKNAGNIYLASGSATTFVKGTWIYPMPGFCI